MRFSKPMAFFGALLSLSAWADRGMIFIGRPTVSVYESGQKAIVAFNRGQETRVYPP